MTLNIFRVDIANHNDLLTRVHILVQKGNLNVILCIVNYLQLCTLLSPSASFNMYIFGQFVLYTVLFVSVLAMMEIISLINIVTPVVTIPTIIIPAIIIIVKMIIKIIINIIITTGIIILLWMLFYYYVVIVIIIIIIIYLFIIMITVNILINPIIINILMYCRLLIYFTIH